MLSGPKPDVTLAQFLALLTFIVSEALAAGWVDGHTSKLIIGIGGIVVPAAWKLADAHLRGKRVIAHAMEYTAEIQQVVADNRTTPAAVAQPTA